MEHILRNIGHSWVGHFIQDSITIKQNNIDKD